MIRMVAPIVEQLGTTITTQVVHSIVIFGWCKFDAGAKPPPLDYLKTDSIVRYIGRDEAGPPNEDEKRWDTIIDDYNFNNLDEFDAVLLKFVESSILDEDEILKHAKENKQRLDGLSRAGSLESSWRPFHDSFADNEDDVCSKLVDGLRNNLDIISLSNADEVITILRNLDRGQLADSLIEFAVEAAPNTFWLPDDPFGRPIHDSRLKQIVADKREAAKPTLNFESDLVATAENMNQDKLAQLASVPMEEYLALFESRSGEQLRRVVLSAIEYRRISNASNDMRAIVGKAEEALKVIGKKSKLNALRVRKYGISLE